MPEPGCQGEVRGLGVTSGDLPAVEKLTARLRRQYEAKLSFCYEAGPCGFVLARRLRQPGHECIVVAPSKIARAAGDRIKTDRRDAAKLAGRTGPGTSRAFKHSRGHRRGHPRLVPCTHRCRRRPAPLPAQRLKSFLLHHGHHYQGKGHRAAAHLRYLRELVLPHPAMQAILEECHMAINNAAARVQCCEKAGGDLLVDWRLRPAVEALMAFKGFQIVAAMITVSELGALARCEHPRKLMA